MENPLIKLEIDREHSESPRDAGFNELLKRSQEEHNPLAAVLEEISRSAIKKAIITSALVEVGYDWRDMRNMNEEAAQAFGHLLAFWDFPMGGKPKSNAEHTEEALLFTRKL